MAVIGGGARGQALDLGLDPFAVAAPLYAPGERAVLDSRPAEEFFAVPRIGAVHTDAAFTAQLTALYERLLGPLVGEGGDAGGGGLGGCSLLDLCSSSHSHLPPGLRFGAVVGHGVNEEELEANPALSSRFCKDLNHHTTLPLPPASMAAVLCCNGLQYLTRPEWVMAEVCRVLSPGGLLVVAFSDCCWAERAAAGWLGRSCEERLELVEMLMRGAGLTSVERHLGGATDGGAEAKEEAGSGPGSAAAGAGRPDPFFAVVGRKAPLVVDLGGEGELYAVEEELDAAAVAASFPGPALRELEIWHAGGSGVTDAVLERWRDAYGALVEDAASLGVPRSAIPQLAPDAGPEDVRRARDHLENMIASFLSSGL